MKLFKKEIKINKNQLFLIGVITLLFALCLVAFLTTGKPSTSTLPTSVKLSLSEAELNLNQSLTLTVTTDKEDGEKDVSWKTDDEDVVQVKNGVLTAKSLGSTTITALVSETVKATCTVSVITPVDDFEFKLNSSENAYILTNYKGEDSQIVTPNNYKNLPIIAIGENAFYNNGIITSITLGNKVKSLSTRSFNNLANLKTINLPDGIENIESKAFAALGNLELNKEENGNLLYLGNKSNPYLLLIRPTSSDVTKCTVSEKTKLIYAGAFSGCSNLEEIFLSNGVQYIGENAFYGLENLKTTKFENAEYVGTKENPYFAIISADDSAGYLNINNKAKVIAKNTLSNLPNLKRLDTGSGITQIDSYAFTDRTNENFATTNLETLIIGNGVKSIGSYAFENQENLSLLSLGSGLTSIGTGAFYKCTSLETLVIPSNVTTIGNGAFYKCSNLSELYISSGVKTIGMQAFYECVSLKSIYLPETLTRIGQAAFANCYAAENLEIAGNTALTIEKLAFQNLFNLRSADLGGVKSIGSYAFENAIKLSELELGKNITSIASGAFASCFSIIELDLPDTLKTIDELAFRDCYGLLNIRLGKSLSSVADDAFINCNKVLFVNNYSNYTVVDTPVSNTTEKTVFIPAENVLVETQLLNAFVKDGEFVFHVDYKNDKDDTNDEYFLVSYVGDASELTLPEYYDGKAYTVYKYALYNNPNLTKLTVPATVLGVQEYAFANCHNLYELDLNGVTADANATAGSDKLITPLTTVNSDFIFDNDTLVAYTGNQRDITLPAPSEIGLPEYSIAPYAFYSNSNITSVVIPDGVKSIGEYAFALCSSLKTITVPSTLTSLGEGAFCYAVSLTNIDLSQSKVSSIEDNAFYGCYNLSDVKLTTQTTKIGKNAFRFNFALKQFTFPTDLVEICDFAFYNCLNLQAVILSDSVKTIGEKTFAYCYRIAELKLSSSLESLGEFAFAGCNGLTSVAIPASLSLIDKNAFLDCENLTEFIVNENNANYKSVDGVLFNKDMTELICYPIGSSAKEYLVPETVVKISDNALYNAINLVEIVLPEGLTHLGINAFYGCKNLISLSVPSTIESVKNLALSTCKSLQFNLLGNAFYLGNEQNPYLILVKAKATNIKSCQIHENTKFIYSSAFKDCTALEEIEIPAEIIEIGENAFNNCTALKGVSFAHPDGWSATKINDDDTVSTEEIAQEKLSNKISALNMINNYSEYILSR